MFSRSVTATFVAVAVMGGMSCTEPNPYLNVCSNNVLEPEIGEECDDGFDGNSDHAACTLSCKRAFCGDGLVHTGVELCDDGERNDELGPCTPWCEPPRCGDGVVQPLEECDDGDDNKLEADGLGGCSTSCTALPRCGDGLHQAPWEECDDANADDTDACTSTCKMATCGDGLLQAGVEICDDGNTAEDDACLSDCTPAICGDGIRHVDVEECDDGDDNNGDACKNDCTKARCGDGVLFENVEWCDDGNDDNYDGCNNLCHIDRLVFVTAQVWGASQVNGIGSAIGKCHLAAKAFGHPRPEAFYAWLSDGEESASEWLYHSQGRYLLSTGEVIADDWDDLTDGALDHAINRGIDGELIEGPVWTGTAPDGSAYPEGHCGGWKESSLDHAIHGYSDLKGEGWTNYAEGSGTCSDVAHLYCVEGW